MRIGVFAAILFLSACSHEFSAVVITVTDGDTIVVDSRGTKRKIRLFGIDAPEYGQPFGKEAHDFTSTLSLSKSVRIEGIETDSHGRLVARVYLNDGRYLNGEIVAAGYAWWFRKYAPRDDYLKNLEAQARAARKGLWNEQVPVEPWNFRQDHHRPADPPYQSANAGVEITYLHCNGTGQMEPDEYVEIKNRTPSIIDLSGWILHDQGSNHSIQFPSNSKLHPQQKCKIFTNLEGGCFSFAKTKSAVWNNSGDRAHLKDASGRLIATRSCDS